MTGQTYATRELLPPREEWVPRLFLGEEVFYFIELPADDDLNAHAEINPGTVMIIDPITGETLWRRQ